LIGWASRVPLAVAAVLAAGLASAPALAADSRSHAPDERISVKDNFFSARSVTVHEGDVVRWTWRGSNHHNITFKKVPAGASRRGAMTRGYGRWQRKFRVQGQYRYVCTLFTGMRGTITVEAPAAEPSGDVPVSAREQSAAGPSAGGPQ
jgi:plastocyanin